MTTVLVVAVVLWNAALTVAGIISYRRMSAQIAAKSSENLYAVRYQPPVADAVEDFLPPLDTAGAWAAEMASAGVRVTDADLAMQRRMRLAENL